MRAISMRADKEIGIALVSAEKVCDLDLVDSLLTSGYSLAYLSSEFKRLRTFFRMRDAFSLLEGGTTFLNISERTSLINAFSKSEILVTSRGMQSIFNVAASTVVKWRRVLVRHGFLFARWSKGTWKIYKWTGSMRRDVNPEYNLLHVTDAPQWFQPDAAQIEAWNKRIRACDEEIRLRKKYGIPLGNDGEYRFVLSRREESERLQKHE
jgi:hypothetical protein